MLQDVASIVFDEDVDLWIDGKETKGKVDITVTNTKNGKKLYLLVKGSDTLPASLVDVAILRDLKNDDKHQCMIFCEQKDNEYTKRMAKNYNIDYVTHERYLMLQLKKYFDI